MAKGNDTSKSVNGHWKPIKPKLKRGEHRKGVKLSEETKQKIAEGVKLSSRKKQQAKADKKSGGRP